MSEANKALIQRLVEEGVNQRKLAVVKELCQDCAYYSPATGELKGDALLRFYEALQAAFPDGRQTILEQIAEGDKVVTRWSFTGTHQGPFMGSAPTHRQVTLTGICIDRIVDGRIVEEREESDALGLMRQLGLSPGAMKVAA